MNWFELLLQKNPDQARHYRRKAIRRLQSQFDRLTALAKKLPKEPV